MPVRRQYSTETTCRLSSTRSVDDYLKERASRAGGRKGRADLQWPSVCGDAQALVLWNVLAEEEVVPGGPVERGTVDVRRKELEGDGVVVRSDLCGTSYLDVEATIPFPRPRVLRRPLYGGPGLRGDVGGRSGAYNVGLPRDSIPAAKSP